MRQFGFAVAVLSMLALAGCDGQGNPPWSKSPTPVVGKNSFKGTVKAEFLVPDSPADYYRDMRLLAPFGYVDPDGVSWDVPEGAITNGASVPWGFWNIVGGPYDGPYRDAAVIHDYYVEKKTRSWEDTHRMFFNAIQARGISDTLARTMYAGVRYGGPRWELAAVPPAPAKAQVVDVPAPPPSPRSDTPPAGLRDPDSAAATAPPVPQPPDPKPLAPAEAHVPPVRSLGRSTATDTEMRNFDELRLWIEREKPSLDEIDRKVEQMRAREGKPAARTP
ncbi:MAG: DUF1353 domain-containing protein [Hyphomicrobium sp.]